MLPFLKKAISFVKKAFLVVAVYFVVINFFFYFIGKDRPAQPMEDPIEKNRAEIYKILDDPKLKTSKEGKITLAVYRSMMCGMIGEACTDNPADGDKNFNHSLFGYMTNLIVLPYANPPASGIYWAYTGLQNAGFVPKTYAAEGIGFAAIKPFMNIWKIFRDVAYMLLVIVLIAIGFMIMFRMKLNQQTVIGIENALPKIVVSLLLITFSFAIAGLLIDLMYVVIAVSVSILSHNGLFYNASNFSNDYIMASGSDIFRDMSARTLLGGMWFKIGDAILGIVPMALNMMLRTIVGVATVILINSITHQAIVGPISQALDNINAAGFSLGKIPQAFLGTGLSFLLIIILWTIGFGIGLPLIMYVIIFLTVLMLFFRIFFLLITTYLKLILLIVFSPLFILIEAIPGRSAFAYWLKNIINNLLVFPIVIIVFLLGYIIVNTRAISSGLTVRFPYLYGISPDAFTVILGMGLIFMIPDIVKAAQQLLGVKELPINLGVGTFFGGATETLSKGTGLLGQVSSIGLGIQAITGKSLHAIFTKEKEKS